MHPFFGHFTDPNGHKVVLQAPNELEYRQLVTKKLAAGWRQDGGLVAKPIDMTTKVCLGSAPVVEPVVVEIDLPDLPSAEERMVAVAEALEE